MMKSHRGVLEERSIRMSDEYYLNCLGLCLSHSTELCLCFAETGGGRAVEEVGDRAREGLEEMEANTEIEESEMWKHIRVVCEATERALADAIAKEQDYRALREHIFGVAAEDAKVAKGYLHFGAGLKRSGALRRFVRCALEGLRAVAKED